jgi:hypothetical protein
MEEEFGRRRISKIDYGEDPPEFLGVVELL